MLKNALWFIHIKREKIMPSLQVRELPENIYRLLQKKAQAEHRSLAQEAVVVLAEGLNSPISHKQRRSELLNNIMKNPCKNKAVMQMDPVELINEDRQR